MEIALLIPCYNEAPTIQKVITSFRKEIPDIKIYVYDNNSTDDTAEKAKQENAIVRYEYRQGKANVIRSMFRDIDADIYIMVDGDGTYSAQEVKKLIIPIEEGYYMVTGDRFTMGGFTDENKRRFHQFGNNLVRFLINKIFKSNIKDIMTGYRAFNKDFVKNYPILCKEYELETEMSIFALNNNIPFKEVPVSYHERPKGSISKLNTLRDGMKVIITIFNLFRHYRPFLFFGIISLIIFLCSLLVGFPVIIEYIKYKYIYKVPSAILASGLMLISFISFAIGIILDTISMIDKKNFQANFNRKSS